MSRQKTYIFSKKNTTNQFTVIIITVWTVAAYGCESWALRKNEEARLDAFQLKGLRKILQVSWTENK